MSKTRYIGLRLLHTVFLLFLVLTTLFLLFRLMPGSYVDLMVHQGASETAIEAFEEQWGLNRPLHEQYLTFLQEYLSLNAGVSTRFREPVIDVVRLRMVNTFILAGPAITLSYIVGAVYGTVLADRKGTLLERYGFIPLLVIGFFPSFFIAIVLIVIFSGLLGIFPASGMIPPSVRIEYADAPWWRIYFTKSFLMHYSLPFFAIVLRYTYLPTLIMRLSSVEVMDQEFIYYHRITGLPKLTRLRQLGKHAILPLITMYPVSMTRALGGLVLIETVFNWPGIGFALVQAVLGRDFPVVQFVFFVIAVFIIVANFLVDLAYSYIDPRVAID